MRPGVAIIDSGVHPGHPHVRGFETGRCFVPGEKPTAYLDYLGHGTAVAGAICEKCESPRLFVAKVFHHHLSTSIDVLLAALDWCLEQPVELVNLSLSTSNPAHAEAFAVRVTRAASLGVRVVAAASELPGSLPGVVGVRLDDAVPRERYGADFSACGWPRPIPGRRQDENFYGVSFAVANVTGCLARELELEAGGDRIKSAFECSDPV